MIRDHNPADGSNRGCEPPAPVRTAICFDDWVGRVRDKAEVRPAIIRAALQSGFLLIKLEKRWFAIVFEVILGCAWEL